MAAQRMAAQIYLFRYGADMDPRRIRRELPAAVFVARAHGEIAGADVWGIVLAVSEPVTSEDPVRVLTDDGRAVEAVVQTTAADLADARAVLRQVRFWELPFAYAQRWEAAVPDPDQLA